MAGVDHALSAVSIMKNLKASSRKGHRTPPDHDPQALIRILAVEDDASFAAFLETALKALQTPERCQFHAVPSLVEGLERLKAGGVDVVLLDLGLPDSAGLATVETLVSQFPDVAVVVMSGQDDQRLMLQAIEAGAQDYLVKGQVSRDELLRAMRYALARQARAADWLEGLPIAAPHDRPELQANAYRAMVRALSHDARTPLNTVIGYLDMMDAEVLGPLPHPQYRDYVHVAHEAAGELQHLLDDLVARRRYALADTSTAMRQEIGDLSPDFVAVLQDGVVQMINQAGLDLLGAAQASQVEGFMLAAFVSADDQHWVKDGARPLLIHRGRVGMVLQTLQGTAVDVEVTAQPLGSDGDGAVLVVARDVRDRVNALRAVQARETRLLRILETIPDALVIVDEDGIVETFNPAAEAMFDRTSHHVVGARCGVLFPSQVVSDVLTWIKDVTTNAPQDQCSEECMVRETLAQAADGRLFPVTISMGCITLDERSLAVMVVRNVSAQRESEARLRFLATRDPLTKLPNLRLLMERMAQAVQMARQSRAYGTVLCVNVDQFRRINDAFGRAAGDEVLCQVAKRLERAIDPADTLGRTSNDQFLVIRDHTAHDQAQVLASAKNQATAFQAALAEPFVVQDRSVYLSASVGIALFGDQEDAASEVIRNADTALHHVKKGHTKGTVQVYSDAMRLAMVRRAAVDSRLRAALKNQELRVVYQPKVNLRTKQIIGAEALCRWDDPELGSVSPQEFVAVAEETGLILELGDWVMHTVCAQIAAWREAGLANMCVAVNLSPRQFRDPMLLDRIMGPLDANDVMPGQVELELTESVIVEDPDDAVEILWTLKQQGLSVAIDDFGTGYSSLSYLKRFPIRTLKIDRSFVKDLPHAEDDSAIARAIISLAHSLDMDLVAEGVESDEQLTFLRRHGCNLGQGFLFDRPMDAGALAEKLRAQEFAPDGAG